MARAVLDASAVIALLRDEPGAAAVAEYAGDALISAVNVHEVAKALLIQGIPLDVALRMIDALRLEVRPHGVEDAYAAAGLYDATCRRAAVWGTKPAWRWRSRRDCQRSRRMGRGGSWRSRRWTSRWRGEMPRARGEHCSRHRIHFI